MSAKIYVATESFVVMVDGKQETIKAGKTRVREGHPLLKGRERYFRELEVQYEVEQATAAPGEKRNTTLGKSSAPKPSTTDKAKDK